MRSIVWAAVLAAFLFVSCNDGVVDPPTEDPFVNPCLVDRAQPPSDGVHRLKTKTEYVAPDTNVRARWTEYVYDEKGRLVVECRYSEEQANNHITGFDVYGYGDGNDPAMRERYIRTPHAEDSYGQTELRVYTYENGRPVGEESLNYINGSNEITVYYYTSAGKLDRKSFFENGFLDWYVKYLYDDEGRLVEEQEFTARDVETQRTSYVYRDGRHVESKIYEMPPKTLIRAIRFSYDDLGRLSSETSIDQDSTGTDETYVARYEYY